MTMTFSAARFDDANERSVSLVTFTICSVLLAVEATTISAIEEIASKPSPCMVSNGNSPDVPPIDVAKLLALDADKAATEVTRMLVLGTDQGY